jgi:protease-3
MARFSTGDLTTLIDKPGSKLQTELEQFFVTHYSANTMKVALTGPRTIKELEVVANQYLLQIPNRKIEKQPTIEPMVTPKQLAIKVEMKPTANIKMLQVNFLVPSVKAEYMYKPGEYISRLIGSDHQGGLSDTLIKAGLVDSVMAGFSNSYSELYSLFSVQFKLTNKGLKNEDEILTALYAYIALVEKEGINETQYDALKQRLDTRFTHLSKQAGFNYVMGLSASMQLYPTKEVIFQPYRLERFNKEFISELMGYLTPQNSRLFLLGPNVKGGTPIPHYKGEYFVSKIPMKQQTKWLKDAKSLVMLLPVENHWLADNLAVLDKTNTDKAIKLVDEKGHSVWFQNSLFFDEPKSSITLQLNSDVANKEVKSSVAMALMSNMLNKSLFDLNFLTTEAGVNFSVYRYNGLTFKTSGYSQKQPELILVLLDHTKNVKFSEQSLNLAKQELQRLVGNKRKSKPLNLAMEEMGRLLRLRQWTDEDVLKVLDTIKMSDIDALKSALFSQSTLRLLALGNISKDQVLALDKAVQERITLQEKAFYQSPLLQADSTKGAINYQLTTQLEDDALVLLFVSDQKSEKDVATSELLNQLLKPAFYDQIRTQEQLTYSPFSLSFPIEKKAVFGLLTQTPAVSNAELYVRFNAFLVQFMTTLEKFDANEFAKIKQAHLANYTAKPSSLSGEFSFLSDQWGKIESDINGKQAYIDLLESVSLEDVQTFYKKIMMDEKGMQKIIIQVQGQRFKAKPLLKVKGEISITKANQL